MTFLTNLSKEYAPPPTPGEYPTVGNSSNPSAILNLFKGKKVSDLVQSLASQTTKTDIETYLKQRLVHPESIDQGSTSLCGPAAFFYCLASKRPELYTRYVVEMALYGKVHLSLGGTGSNGLTVDAPIALLKPCPGIDIVDWITLGTLRSGDNPVLGLECKHSMVNDFASITKPESIASWFRRIGCSDVTMETQLLHTQGIDNLVRAQNKVALGHSVCLLIQSNILDSYAYRKPLHPPTFHPDHWIVLTSNIQLDGSQLFTNLSRNSNVSASLKGLTFQVYSWGNKYPCQFEPEVFLKYYHGFVSARW